MSKGKDVPYTVTLEVRDACLCLHLQRAARAVARHFDRAFQALDITNGQFSLLMSLNRPEPPTMGSVAELLAMDRTTLTAALKPLERRGLVRVSIDKADRRNRRLSLTKTGETLLAKGVPIWRREHAMLDQLLGGSTSSDHLRKDLNTLSFFQSVTPSSHAA
jgi:DNA-binding MarR family transcriptional regulator